MTRRFLAAFIGVLLFSNVAWAQTKIEFSPGPILSSNRVVGVGGAFLSVAEGADAHLITPASFAMRYNWARNDFFDWDWSLYWLLSTASTRPDITGNPDASDGSFFLGGGLDARMSKFGIGVHALIKRYDLDVTLEDGSTQTYRFNQIISRLGFGWASSALDIVFGLSIDTVAIAMNDPDTQTDVLGIQGGGLSLGAVWAPTGKPFRVGFKYDSPALAAESTIEPPVELMDVVDIEAMEVPAEVGIGASYMFWDRVYNPTRTFGSVKPDEIIGHGGRRYVLLTADVIMHMPVKDAVGVVSYLSGNPEVAGNDHTFSPRFGAESEFWANQMRARMGGYLEPSRIESQSSRMHFTAGLDFRVHVLIDWRLNGVIDFARRYYNWGVGIGFWH